MKFLFNYLKMHNSQLTSCESFTGGMFSEQLTNISGASAYFLGGFICYSNNFKISQVKIPSQIIKKHSEVSKITLAFMLEQTQTLLGGDVCFAFTGFAPPHQKNNPRAGLSYVGFRLKQQNYIEKFDKKGIKSRKRYRKAAIKFILNKFKEVCTK